MEDFQLNRAQEEAKLRAITPGMDITISAHAPLYVGDVKRGLEHDISVKVISDDGDIIRVGFDKWIAGFKYGYVKRDDLKHHGLDVYEF